MAKNPVYMSGSEGIVKCPVSHNASYESVNFTANQGITWEQFPGGNPPQDLAQTPKTPILPLEANLDPPGPGDNPLAPPTPNDGTQPDALVAPIEPDKPEDQLDQQGQPDQTDNAGDSEGGDRPADVVSDSAASTTSGRVRLANTVQCRITQLLDKTKDLHKKYGSLADHYYDRMEVLHADLLLDLNTCSSEVWTVMGIFRLVVDT